MDQQEEPGLMIQALQLKTGKEHAPHRTRAANVLNAGHAGQSLLSLLYTENINDSRI